MAKPSPQLLITPSELKTAILNEQHREILTCLFFGKLKRLNLLYRASRDGWGFGEFHARCWHKGPTLSVCRTSSLADDNPHVLGGFTHLSWGKFYAGEVNEAKEEDKWFSDSSAFIFSFRARAPGVFFTKLSSCNTQAVYRNDPRGPLFGRGYDLSINVRDKQATSVIHSYNHQPPFSLGQSITGPLIVGVDTPLDEIEIFSCDF